MERECRTCHIEKPLTSAHFRPHQNGQGFRHQCRKCTDKRSVEYFRTHIKKIMVQSAKHRAKRDNVPFAITEDDFAIPECCPALGVKLRQGSRYDHSAAPTLDRVVPSLGYVPGNIRVISHRANLIKNNATVHELQNLVWYLQTPVKVL
jgi:hypothetical protein